MSRCPICGRYCPPEPDTGYDADDYCSPRCADLQAWGEENDNATRAAQGDWQYWRIYDKGQTVSEAAYQRMSVADRASCINAWYGTALLDEEGHPFLEPPEDLQTWPCSGGIDGRDYRGR